MTFTELELTKMAQDALVLKNNQRWQDAASKFEKILKVRPDWEHGYGWFNLAECYEECGRISDARVAYERAVLIASTDPVLLGGLASFLYLHGRTEEAFDEYVRLLALDRARGDAHNASISMSALATLGSRLGWSGDQLAIHINQKLAKFSP